MVNHLTGVEAGELVVAAARSGTFAILPVGCPACLADDRLAVNRAGCIPRQGSIGDGSELNRLVTSH
jgi:hypothetical protein